MIAWQRIVASSFLRRTGLLAGILAVLVGLLGMHVVVGHHIVHVPETTAGGYSSIHLSSPGHDVPGVFADTCSCSDGCTGTSTMTVSCIPSGKTASLSVQVPGAAVHGVTSRSFALGAARTSYTYSPSSPSPAELSISTT